MDIFEKIYNLKLERNDKLVYTLGDNTLDTLWGLDQEYPSFAPSKDQIENFAAFTYLFGICGYTPYNFSAIPSGYVATYKSGDDYKTVLIGKEDSAVLNFYKEKLLELVKSKANRGTHLGRVYDYLKWLLEGKDMSLKEVCLSMGFKLNNMNAETAKIFKERISKAMFEFSSDEKSLNSRNCDQNHIILDMITSKVLGYDYKNLNDEQKEKVRELSEDILNNWIYKGYLTYRGYDRNDNPLFRDENVLNRLHRLDEINEKLHSFEGISKILTMCATDYSADLVYKVLEVMNECQDIDLSEEKIDQIVANTRYNEFYKEQSYDYLNNLSNKRRKL